MEKGRTNSTVGRDALFFVVSFIVHAVVLTWGMITFAAKPIPQNPNEAMPIDIISVTEFTQLTAGARTALKVETPKQVAEKIAEPKPVDDPTAKIEKKVVNAATDQPPPMPEPKPPAPAEKKQSEPKRDLIADAIKKDLAKKSEPKKSEQKKAEAKADAKAETKAPPKKDQPKFDPRKVEALLDKRTPQRLAATGDSVNNTPGLGVPLGTAQQLSMSELDALRARLAQLWNPPVGAGDPEDLVVYVRIRLKPDGTLAAPPAVLNPRNSSLFMAAATSATAAVRRGQPFDMLKPEHYELWQDIEIKFDPKDMIRG